MTSCAYFCSDLSGIEVEMMWVDVGLQSWILGLLLPASGPVTVHRSLHVLQSHRSLLAFPSVLSLGASSPSIATEVQWGGNLALRCWRRVMGAQRKVMSTSGVPLPVQPHFRSKVRCVPIPTFPHSLTGQEAFTLSYVVASLTEYSSFRHSLRRDNLLDGRRGPSKRLCILTHL